MAGKWAVGQVSPLALTSLRWLVACAALAPLVAQPLSREWHLLLPSWRYILLMGGWLSLTLPAMPNRTRADAFATFKVLRRPRVPLGMAAAALFFLGQFALFTYLRPFLETVTRVDTSTLSALLLVLGVSGLVGTFLIGRILQTRLYGALVTMPLAMALLAVGLIGLGSSLLAVAGLLALWGLIGTAAPVGWWTWVSKALPGDAEAGGGLMVAVVQLAITGGAAFGGLLFDHAGYQATFMFSALVLVGCAVAALLSAHGDRATGDR